MFLRAADLIVGIFVGTDRTSCWYLVADMTTNRLSDATVRNAKGRPSPYKLGDGGGLHLLVTPPGGRLWRLAYRYAGKQKTLALGAYPAIGLADARTARDAAKKVLAQGRDPALAKLIQGQVDTESRRATFAEVAKAWFKARKNRWVPAYGARIWSRVEGDLISALGEMPIDDIESSHVLAALQRIERRGAIEMAHRVKNYADDIFRFARAAKLMVSNPTEELVHALTSPAPKKRRSALRARDLPDFLVRLRTYDGDPRTRLAIQLTLLTFVRTKELRFARWDQFEKLEADEPLWRVPPESLKKKENEHLVPLARQTVRILRGLETYSEGEDFVFGAPTKSGVISENTMLYALYRMGYHSRATVHGFRGTASTILNERGFNRDWIERQLAHTEQDQVRAAYNVAEWLPERRQMMQWWADYLEEQGLLIDTNIGS
jgi:integrase